MNSSIEEFKSKIQGKKVAVIGIGINNIPLIKFLIKNEAVVTGCDKKSKEELGENYCLLEEMGCNFSLGENYLSNLNNFEYIFRTPGMRYDTKELEEARKNGAVITSETQLFFELCPCQIFAITGSDGKTTTTTLTYLILKEEGYNCYLGGNIGTPLIDKVEEMNENDKVVLELSSFQLHTLRKSPHTAVITNITPNHLDYHKDMQEYIEAKENIFLYQNHEDRLILNYDNDITRKIADKAKGKVTFFSRKCDFNEGVFVSYDSICVKKHNIINEVIEINDIRIPGLHNVENYMAAIAATWDYVEVDTIIKIATTFTGVEHRIEFVKEIDGIKFYNDSIGSSPTRTEASISSFNQKVILIAGGYDKKIPFDDFGKVVVEKTKKVFLIGNTADKIEESIRAVDPKFSVIKCIDLEEAVRFAYEDAEKGDIVILSPACASFDMYKNFEERGNHFKHIVHDLQKLI